jgi:hypothetical protein
LKKVKSMEIQTRCHCCARPFEVMVNDGEEDAQKYVIPAGRRATCPACGHVHHPGFEMKIIAKGGELLMADATTTEEQPALIWETSVRISLDLSKCLEPGQDPPTIEAILKELLEDHPLVDDYTVESASSPRIVDYNKPKVSPLRQAVTDEKERAEDF